MKNPATETRSSFNQELDRARPSLTSRAELRSALAMPLHVHRELLGSLLTSGGGVRNQFILQQLSRAPAPADLIENSDAKEALAFLVCIIGAFVMILAAGINPTNLVVVVPTMWISCHLFYVRYFKPKGIAPWLETLSSHNQAV